MHGNEELFGSPNAANFTPGISTPDINGMSQHMMYNQPHRKVQSMAKVSSPHGQQQLSKLMQRDMEIGD
jgi:hypothetical protein